PPVATYSSRLVRSLAEIQSRPHYANLDNGEKRIPSPETIEAGRMLLGQLVFEPHQERVDRNDYTLAVVP
ncbi:hypothetical protein, partial [Mesorhizobium intechi]|uniref:hypothetical protein n=1 Tax=Mesorhizobium intechi TaxID=537601 RepID=UPI00142E9C5E